MANADLTRLMDNVRMALPGALDGAVQLEMFNAMTEFFQHSKCWTEDVEFDTDADEDTYELVTTEPAAIDSLMGMVNEDGSPVAATMAEPGTIVLGTIPTADTTLTATVSLTVDNPLDRDGYPVFPAWVLTKYGNYIIDGVLARMMLQPAKPYTNQQLGVYHRRTWRSGLVLARSEARRANLYRAQNWRFPAFAQGSQR